MKKTILASVFLAAMFAFSNSSLAQSVTTIQNKAIQVAKQRGYTAGYTGKIVASANQVGTCGTVCTPKTKYEVFVAPKSTPTTRMAPFAKVTMCGTTVLSIENLRQP